MSTSFLTPSSRVYEDHYTGQRVNEPNGTAIRAFSLLTMIMALVPLTLFIRIRQVGPCSLILISMMFSLFAVINSSIWNNEENTQWYDGAGICHVIAPLRQPLTVAFSFAMVLMPWKLIETLKTKRVVQQNRVLRDILFVWSIPLIFVLPFQYFVMTKVYSVIPGFGCVPEFDETWLSLVIVYMWWPLLLVLTFILSIIMCIMIHRKREEISNSLNDNSSRVTQRTFIKLYVMAIIIIAIYIPVQLLFILRFVPVHYESKRSGLGKSDTWSNPSFYHTSDDPQIQYQPWAYIAINFLMFLFYGASNDAQKLYLRSLQKMGLGKILPISNNSHSASDSASDSVRDSKNLLSYGDLVGFVTRKFEKRRQDDSEKSFELSQGQEYSQTSKSAATILKSFDSLEYPVGVDSNPRVPQYSFWGVFRTLYNIRLPFGAASRSNYSMKYSDSSISSIRADEYHEKEVESSNA